MGERIARADFRAGRRRNYMKVSVRDLTKIFPARGRKKGEDVVAAGHVSFEIEDGETASAHGGKDILRRGGRHRPPG